jgi:hypothetical protein
MRKLKLGTLQHPKGWVKGSEKKKRVSGFSIMDLVSSKEGERPSAKTTTYFVK